MILVTGGTGMLGGHLLKELIKSGEKIRALKRTTSNFAQIAKIFSLHNTNIKLIEEKIEWIDCDLLDYSSLIDCFEGVDKVYHLAAQVSFNPKDARQMIKNNVEATTNIVNCSLAKHVEKLSFVSSIAALGNSENGMLISEDTKIAKDTEISAYSKSKFLSEMEIWRGVNEGLKCVVVNPAVILGAGNWKSGSPLFFSKVWRGLRFYTHGVTGFVDVHDVVDILIKLCNAEIQNERFVLSAENLSYYEIFKKIAQSLNCKAPSIEASPVLTNSIQKMSAFLYRIFRIPPLITKDTARSAHNKSYYSNKKICDKLNYTFTPIDKTIERIGKQFLSDIKKSDNAKTTSFVD